mmetsp:Transcript_63515/g.178758  ORF Transcript_63515/g.178758 Transcript_63515/m.178758 type:complete len:470 (-) Transcript_63515:671-2080(-)
MLLGIELRYFCSSPRARSWSFSIGAADFTSLSGTCLNSELLHLAQCVGSSRSSTPTAFLHPRQAHLVFCTLTVSTWCPALVHMSLDRMESVQRPHSRHFHAATWMCISCSIFSAATSIISSSPRRRSFLAERSSSARLLKRDCCSLTGSFRGSTFCVSSRATCVPYAASSCLKLGSFRFLPAPPPPEAGTCVGAGSSVGFFAPVAPPTAHAAAGAATCAQAWRCPEGGAALAARAASARASLPPWSGRGPVLPGRAAAACTVWFGSHAGIPPANSFLSCRDTVASCSLVSAASLSAPIRCVLPLLPPALHPPPHVLDADVPQCDGTSADVPAETATARPSWDSKACDCGGAPREAVYDRAGVGTSLAIAVYALWRPLAPAPAPPSPPRELPLACGLTPIGHDSSRCTEESPALSARWPPWGAPAAGIAGFMGVAFAGVGLPGGVPPKLGMSPRLGVTAGVTAGDAPGMQ